MRRLGDTGTPVCKATAMMNYTFWSATILLVLITDPIGNIPIFANALKHVAPERRPRVILREILIAFSLLLTFMFVGEGFLRVMNLSELALQIGGGVILFLIALRMVFPPPSTTESELLEELNGVGETHHDSERCLAAMVVARWCGTGWASVCEPVSYTHLTLPTNREV